MTESMQGVQRWRRWTSTPAGGAASLVAVGAVVAAAVASVGSAGYWFYVMFLVAPFSWITWTLLLLAVALTSQMATRRSTPASLAGAGLLWTAGASGAAGALALAHPAPAMALILLGAGAWLAFAAWADLASAFAGQGVRARQLAAVGAVTLACVAFAATCWVRTLGDPEPHPPWALVGTVLFVAFSGLTAWAATERGSRPGWCAGGLALSVAGLALFDPWLRFPGGIASVAALGLAGTLALLAAHRVGRKATHAGGAATS